MQEEGYDINRKRVQRLMRQMGIVALYPKKNTSKPGKGHKIYPYLLKGLDINRPNQVFCTDITYIAHGERFCLSVGHYGLVQLKSVILALIQYHG